MTLSSRLKSAPSCLSCRLDDHKQCLHQKACCPNCPTVEFRPQQNTSPLLPEIGHYPADIEVLRPVHTEESQPAITGPAFGVRDVMVLIFTGLVVAAILLFAATIMADFFGWSIL